MSEAALREALYASFANRALLYFHLFDELRQELGEERATAIMKRAIYRRGLELGERYRPFAPDDLAGLKEAFLAGVPDGGAMFAPEVKRSDAEALDIKFHRCPLKEAWLEAGIAEDEVAKLCAVAATVDNGTFEGAGFAFYADTWEPGKEGCCRLHIRPQR
jgi:hypothetical protein